MGTQEASSTEECPFCHIANNRTDREILLSDDVLVCFRDVKPGATHHYLVVPRTHINNCKSLQRDDIPLVERMEKMGRSVLEKNKDGFPCASFLFCSPPPPPCSGSSQCYDHQVTASLWVTVLLVHHSRQCAFSAQDTWQGQMKNNNLIYC
uniref:Histidine triad nucleotide-binding protein 3-like n=1 Tax=Mastacembelus armatus TaxID=205130 RepID=A0A3Q3STM7_9TELE